MKSESLSVVTNSLPPHGLYSPWNSPSQNTGVGSHSLLQVSSQPRDWTLVFCVTGRFFTIWATREAHIHKYTHIHTIYPLGFPCDSAGKESDCNVGDLGSIPGLGRSPGEGKGYPLQYFDLESSMDCIVHGVAKSWTWLSDFHFVYINMYTFECYIQLDFHINVQSLTEEPKRDL